MTTTEPGSSGQGEPAPYVPIPVEAIPIGVGRGFPVAAPATAAPEVTGVPPAVGEERRPISYCVGRTGAVWRLVICRGRPVLLTFWATTCGPCRRELRAIVENSQEGDQLVVLAVNPQEDLATIHGLAEEISMNMPVVRDETGAISALYGVHELPTNVIIDRDGKVASVRHAAAWTETGRGTACFAAPVG